MYSIFAFLVFALIMLVKKPITEDPLWVDSAAIASVVFIVSIFIFPPKQGEPLKDIGIQAVFIGVGFVFDGSSPSPSGSSKTLENGEIPGYSSCVKRMMSSNPSAKVKVCCDEVGGNWSQKGSFGTCRK